MAENFVDVRDLWVQCSFKVRNLDRPGLFGSDTCGRTASNATKVVTLGGREDWYWRCTKHAGMVDYDTDSTYIRSVPKEWA